MNASDFSYDLPPDRIAQTPVEPRDSSKLLVLDRASGAMEHRHFSDIGQFLRPGDLLVVNDSKVFKARIRIPGGEVFLLRVDGPYWLAIARPARKIAVGSDIHFVDGATCRVIEKKSDGTLALDFGRSPKDVLAWTDRVGEVPLPPYITPPPQLLRWTPEETSSISERYQTVYAKPVGSVAAPTAGFHFTPALIERLKANGICFASVTLHVGLGTFRPIKTQTIEAHEMHEEWVDVPDETIRAIDETKLRRLPAGRQGRVIAVGTTTVRALESGIRHGFTNVFITPGYIFKVIDGLITNFHLPMSTLLVLVSAFAGEVHANPDEGRRIILRAYEEAIKREYRFYSFGDAMLLS